MNRQIQRIGLFLLGASLVGCGGLHNVRSRPNDVASRSEDEAPGDKVESKPPTKFFKNSRLPGAMSDEGAEVERNLGVR